MQKLMKDIKALVKQECEKVARKCGNTNHSDYESVSVLAEELEELHISTSNVAKEAQDFWRAIKVCAPNYEKKEILKSIQKDATMAAYNAIQTAVMAHRAIKTIENREVKQ